MQHRPGIHRRAGQQDNPHVHARRAWDSQATKRSRSTTATVGALAGLAEISLLLALRFGLESLDTMKALSAGKWIFAIELALGLVLAKFVPIAATIVLLLFLFTLYFFRDPAPMVPPRADLVVSPASGKVDVIEEADEPLFRGERSTRVSIFLSVFDVHTQRAPIDCTVKLIRYLPGKFANAISPSCASENEHQFIGLEGGGIRITVRQIAGLIARRICTWCKEGDVLAKGAHLGMIRFGSRVDIYLPIGVEIAIKPGDHVKGGETILARRKQQ